MKFSVIINNYNYARFLPETLASVKNQTLPAHEIIVVDDGSTDESVKVLKNLAASMPELRVYTQINSGQFSALRVGVGFATGDWCAFLDADDTWTPDHLAAAEEVIQSDPDIDFYYSGHRETSGPPLYKSKWPHGRVGPCIGLVAVKGSRIGTITSAISMKRELTIKVVGQCSCNDSDWRVRADDCLVFGSALAGAIFYYNSIETVIYRIHIRNNFANKIEGKDLIDNYKISKEKLLLNYRHLFKCNNNLVELILSEYVFNANTETDTYYNRKCRQAVFHARASVMSKYNFYYRILNHKIINMVKSIFTVCRISKN